MDADRMASALELRRRARELGTEAGESAASWVFDGNTSDENYRQFLTMWEDGDPQLGDVYGPATGWLSGEYAEGPTPTELAHTLGLDTSDDSEANWSVIDEACDDYETAAEDAYWSELERVARLHTS